MVNRRFVVIWRNETNSGKRRFTLRPVSTEEGTQARWQVRRAVDTLDTIRRGPQRPLDHLAALRHAQERIHDAIGLMSAAARSEGATWTQIGSALEITRQAARQADQRRQQHAQERATARQWRLLPLVRRPRIRWRRAA